MYSLAYAFVCIHMYIPWKMHVYGCRYVFLHEKYACIHSHMHLYVYICIYTGKCTMWYMEKKRERAIHIYSEYIYRDMYIYMYSTCIQIKSMHAHMYIWNCTNTYVYTMGNAPCGRWRERHWSNVFKTIGLFCQRAVSFAKEPYERDDILQSRPMILKTLHLVVDGEKDVGPTSSKP